MFAQITLTNCGGFWSRTRLIASSDEEIAALYRREIPEHRAAQIGLAMEIEARTLLYREVAGRC